MATIDLTNGRTLWRRPIGTAQDSGPMGIPSYLPMLMGVPNMGGSLVTRGGRPGRLRCVCSACVMRCTLDERSVIDKLSPPPLP